MSHAKQLHNRPSFDASLEILTRQGLPGKVKSALCPQVHAAIVATTHQGIAQALAAAWTASVGAER